MLRFRSTAKHVDTFFVLSLLMLFAMTAFVLVLIGAKQYRVTSNSMSHNYETRTATSYIREKMRQFDDGSEVSVMNLDGTVALAFSLKDADTREIYYTYIYHYNNYLRELFITSDSIYSLDSGQEITPLSDFKLKEISGDLIEVNLKDSSGKTVSMYLSHKSGNVFN